VSSKQERPPSDPRRKARFREIARGIVAKDRYNRKYGFAVDTAGAIAQALERAWRDGVSGGPASPVTAIGQADIGPVEWALIPPRSRSAFWTICLFVLARDDRPALGGHLVPAITTRGTAGWELVIPGRSIDRIIGDRTITPLVGLGLIERDPDDLACLVVSGRGQDTWAAFCARGGRYPEDLTEL
jgi:hypothetical protein